MEEGNVLSVGWDSDHVISFVRELYTCGRLSELDIVNASAACELYWMKTISIEAASISGAEAATAVAKKFATGSDALTDDFVSLVNPFEHTLETDPSGIYRRLHVSSKTAYRRHIAERALKTGRDANEVVLDALDQACAAQKQGREHHIGSFIFDAASRTKVLPTDLSASASDLAAVYGTVIGVAAVGVVGLWLSFAPSLSVPWFILQTASMILLASKFVSVALRSYLLRVIPCRETLRLKSNGADDLRTCIVVPTMFANREHIDKVFHQAERNYRIASDSSAIMIVLADFVDSDHQELSTLDRELLDYSTASVLHLNRCYAREGKTSFVLAYRPRSFSATERKWIGHGRKAGKVSTLFSYVSAQPHDLVVVGDESCRLQSLKFAIVLDDDSELSSGCVQALVGAMEHPFHRAVVDDSTGRIVAGHGIFFPSINRNDQQGYARNLNFDLYGIDRFPGKGIYDIAACSQILVKRLPPEGVLSHDTYESIWLRPGYCAEANIKEQHPSTYIRLCERAHRWIRGDWQNLFLMLSFQKRGTLIPLFWWLVVLDQVRDSLLPVCGVSLLMIAVLNHAPAVILPVALVYIFRSLCWPVLYVLGRYRPARWTLGTSVANLFWSCATCVLHVQGLLFRALFNLDAVTFASIAFFRKRSILRWESSAMTEFTSDFTRRSWWYACASSLPAIFFALCGFWNAILPLPVLILLGVWATSPLIILVR